MRKNIIFQLQILFFGLVAAAFSEKLGEPVSSLVAPREGKNLLGTFPFNAGKHGEHHGDHHGHHAHHEEPTQSFNLPARASPRTSAARRFSQPGNNRGQRQGGGDEVELDIGSIAAAGERCIDKVVMIEETVYDDVITCKHSYR